eukprot:scaffold16300_cov150-Cylindrotheca_fusiformis.AAC.9
MLSKATIPKMKRGLWIFLLTSLIFLAVQLVSLYLLTTPLKGNEELQSPEANGQKYTTIHCVGENFLNSSSWQYKSCHYRNLCYNDEKWTIHPSPTQQKLNEYNLWSSTRLSNQYISTIGLHPRWIRNKAYQWSPTIFNTTEGKNPSIKRLWNRAVILISAPPFESELKLLMDTLLPIYNLIEIFGLTDRDDISVHVLNSDQVDTTRLDQGLTRMGYSRFVPPNGSACVAHVAAGIGMLTASGLARRGQVADDYDPLKLRNVARGPLFERFRNHIVRQTLRNAVTSTTTTTTKATTNTLQLALPPSHALSASLLHELQVSVPSIWSVQPVEFDLSHPTDTMYADILSTAASTDIWVADANDDIYTWPAFFLPRSNNSHLVLLYDPNLRVQNKVNPEGEQRPVRLDFVLWNQMTHIRVHWLSKSHSTKTLAHIIRDLAMDGTHPENPEGQKHQEDDAGREVDATFNGMDVRLKKFDQTFRKSRTQCLGENWMRYADVYRSCHMEQICFDMNQSRFFLEMPPLNNDLLPQDVVTTWPNNRTAELLMGQTLGFPRKDVWFPRILRGDEAEGQRQREAHYYALDSNVVWLPYYPMQPNVNNPGHLLWDYWLPLYTLLEMFHLEDKALLLTTVEKKCIATERDLKCYKMTTKFLPLLGVDPSTFASTANSRLVPKDNPEARPSSSLICAKQAVAGIGMLTDHGINKHGQNLRDYERPHNNGRGPMFWNFRNFMLGKMGVAKTRRPFQITFSTFSSLNPSRRRGFERQIEIANTLYPPNNKEGIIVRSIAMAELTLEEQLSTAQDSAVFISVMGGSTSTAMFLQEGTSLVLYYNDIDDFAKGADEPMANRMDWDFWNNASYLRMHWMSIRSMDEERELEAFTLLLQSEIETALEFTKMRNSAS